MRVAILSESSADESALRILVDAILGVATTAPPALSLQSRGWPAVRNIFPVVARQLHYHTDAEGLIVVVDSNHTYLSGDEPKNRLRDFRELVQRCQQQLKPVSGRVPLKIAVGVAAPAIEPYSKLELKKQLYGSDFRSLELMTQKMTEAAHEAAKDLSALERAFPNGFGNLAKELRSWRRIG